MKKVFSLLLAVLMLISALPVAYATNTVTNESEGNATTAVTYTAANAESWTITVPAALAPGGSSGTVTLTGKWPSNKTISVTAQETVTMTNSISKGDEKILDVNFDGISEAGSDTASQTFKKAVSVDPIENALFGTWSGHFYYNVNSTEGAACNHIDRNSDNVCDSCGVASDFATYSWSDIAVACQTDSIPSTWAVGNVKEMEIDGASYTVAIIDEDHDTYADGGTAPLTFQVVDLVGTYNMNATDTNSGSWDGSAMHGYLNNTLINSLPTEVGSNIKAVTKYTNLGGADTGNNATTTEASADKLFLLADAEITGDNFWTWYNDEFIPWMIANQMADASDEEKAAMAEMFANFCAVMKSEGNQYAYYAATGSVTTAPTVEELMNSWDMNYWYSMSHATLSGLDGVAASWWLRSPDPNFSDSFDYVDSTGYNGIGDSASAELGVSFGFCF